MKVYFVTTNVNGTLLSTGKSFQTSNLDVAIQMFMDESNYLKMNYEISEIQKDSDIFCGLVSVTDGDDISSEILAMSEFYTMCERNECESKTV